MIVRLIIDSPRSAIQNMAIDEALMEAQRQPDATACLRFYQWREPAVTCGYFQDVRLIAQKFGNDPVVRRLTGGGLVRHGRDLTFSLTLKESHPFFRGNVKDSYLRVSEALRIGLQSLYPKLDYADCRNALSPRGRGERVCFDQPACYDLLLEGKKVAGSSQRHTDGTVLYQSSLFLSEEPEQVIPVILDGFRMTWKAEFIPSELEISELKRSREIEEERYGSEEWRFLPASFLSKHSGQL